MKIWMESISLIASFVLYIQFMNFLSSPFQISEGGERGERAILEKRMSKDDLEVTLTYTGR